MSIPLLIGIIGHRQIPVDYLGELEAELSQALDDIRSQAPNTPLALVSSLAEGADRPGACWACQGDGTPCSTSI